MGKPAQYVAETALANLGCKTAPSEMWDALNKIVEDGEREPSPDEVRRALLEFGRVKGLDSHAFTAYVDQFVTHYELVVDGIAKRFAPRSLSEWKKALAEMEVGVRITEVHADLTDRIEASQEKLSRADKDLQHPCAQPDTPPPPTSLPPSGPAPSHFATVWDQLKATAVPEIYGARLVLATAYQSCDTLTTAPLNRDTPATQGIEVDSKPNPTNGGKLRHYKSLAQINSTHPYVAGHQLAKASCQEVRNHPPIYDFGGKPYTTSSKPQVLNMFNPSGGSGSEVYGIDCSGFVFTSLASAGLRMISPDPAKPLKASMVNGIPAAALKEPESNGLKCLTKIPTLKDYVVQPGDVVAIKGHVVMIDIVGADPFGLDRIAKSSDCVPGKVTAANFDFVITQSSPSKGGTGINRYAAKDYLLNESATYRSGLEQYAIAACRQKFGLSPNLSSPSLSVVRHKKTRECRVTPMELTGQDCVRECRAI